LSEETPTQAIIGAARGVDVVLEENGRSITVRELRPLEQFRLFKVVGQDSTNGGYVGTAMIAASVRLIDGSPVAFPQLESHVETILERLGFDGWDMVQSHFAKANKPKDVRIEAAKN
jgi:hypothetical protein